MLTISAFALILIIAPINADIVLGNPNYQPIVESDLSLANVFKYNNRIYAQLVDRAQYPQGFYEGSLFGMAQSKSNDGWGFNTPDGSTQNWYNGTIIKLNRFTTNLHVRLLPLGWTQATQFTSGDSSWRAENCARSDEPYVERNFPEGSLMWYMDKLSDPTKPVLQLDQGYFVHPGTGSQADFEALKLTDAEITQVFGTHIADGRPLGYRQYLSSGWAGLDTYRFYNGKHYTSGSLLDRSLMAPVGGLNTKDWQDSADDGYFNYHFNYATRDQPRFINMASSSGNRFSCKDPKFDSDYYLKPVEIITPYTTDFHTFQPATGTLVSVQSSVTSPNPLTSSQQNNIKTAYQTTLGQQYPGVSSWSVSMTESGQRRSMSSDEVEASFRNHLAHQ
jgi:hypothetical protein